MVLFDASVWKSVQSFQNSQAFPASSRMAGTWSVLIDRECSLSVVCGRVHDNDRTRLIMTLANVLPGIDRRVPW